MIPAPASPGRTGYRWMGRTARDRRRGRRGRPAPADGLAACWGNRSYRRVRSDWSHYWREVLNLELITFVLKPHLDFSAFSGDELIITGF